MIQNIERLRFGNTIFEPLWNNKYISNIQITSSETLGIEQRDLLRIKWCFKRYGTKSFITNGFITCNGSSI